MASPENEQEQKTSKKENILFKERFDINYKKPIAELNINNAIAYEAKDITDKNRKLFALICNNKTPPRVAILPHLSAIKHEGVLALVDYGTIDYPPEKSENVILIYEKPNGPKLLNAPKEILEDIKNNREKFKKVIISLLSCVEALAGHGITHRSIRADNIFFKDSNYDSLVLGDCAACFPALAQPFAYETAESCIADKDARGPGNTKNDIYAAAVSLLAMFNGQEFFANFSDDKITKLKISKPGISLFEGYVDFPISLHPLFSGLLEADEEKRWDYVNSYNYLQEKNPTTAKGSGENATKPIIIAGKKIYNPKEAVYALINDKKAGLELIENERFQDWLKEGFIDKSIHKNFVSILKNDAECISNKDLFLAKTCILLAPSMPIFYKSIRVFPQGAGKAIFAAIKNQKRTLDDYKELFSTSLFCFWYSQQKFLRAPSNALEYKSYINNKDYGYGVERIIHDLDEDLPCLSPLLGIYFANTAGKILRTLNKTLKPTDKVFDRPIIAFLRCKLGNKMQDILPDINSTDELICSTAILKLYANLQNKFGTKNLPNLSILMANFCMPSIKRYHNLSLQKSVEEKMIKVSRSGRLQDIIEVLENPKQLKKDNDEYKSALQEKIVLTATKTAILSQEKANQEYITTTANKFGMVLSIIVMLTSFIFSVLNQLY